MQVGLFPTLIEKTPPYGQKTDYGGFFAISDKLKIKIGGVRMYKIAKIVVDKSTISFDKQYDYYVPTSLFDTIKIGCRVTVPFGGYNKRRMGMVMEIVESDNRENLKPLSTQVDYSPILNKESLQIVEFLKNYTFCTYFDAIKVVIPSGTGLKLGAKLEINNKVPSDITLSKTAEDILAFLKSKKGTASRLATCKFLNIDNNNGAFAELISQDLILETKEDKRKIKDEKAIMAKLATSEIELKKLTVKQKLVVDMLKETPTASIKEICYYCGVTKVVVSKLEQIGYIELYEQSLYRSPYESIDYDENFVIELNESQEKAYKELLTLIEKNTFETALLYGVTGSGKTSVFMKLIEAVINKGQNVIVMVPEISLTPQTVRKFQKCFGDKTAVLHSSLTMAQRLDEWKRIREGKARIVVGTRSAVFAPLENIGLIVMDEEQEHTYKSQISPRFHARDVASFRCKNHNAMLLLASATPSIESYYNAKKGKYCLVELNQRYAGAELPDVYIVDMREEISESATIGISQRLVDELYINLQKKEQSILLLNRRGYNTMIKCSSCSETIKCPNCSVALTYHSANNKVMCHYCGYTSDVINECSNCKGKMVRYTGVGTQKAQEELEKIFPDAKILRMDMDTTMTRQSYEKSFEKFARGEYDIMIGTQMVAKGLDFPNVTLVGVLTADQALFSQSFRGYERAFSLITQVVGRGGRGELKGRAFIQTSSPDNQIIELASRQDYKSYYDEEILFRKVNLYPPFCKLTCIGFMGDNEKMLDESAKYCSTLISQIANGKYRNLPVRVLMPIPADVYKVSGKFRYNMLVKHSNTKEFYQMMWEVLEQFGKVTKYKGINMYIDTNYDG
ncbi:MAG: primosomal protein N' [Oscillospiraceae bacterium]